MARYGRATPTMPMLNRMLPAISLLLAACASSPPVTVVSDEPNACGLLGEVNTGGAFYERDAEADAVRYLEKETQALGGDVLVCCSLSDTLVLHRYEGNQYSGRAYRCRRSDEG